MRGARFAKGLVDMSEEDGLYFLSSATPELLGAPFAVRLVEERPRVSCTRRSGRTS